jgi:hypothetical protein
MDRVLHSVAELEAIVADYLQGKMVREVSP